MNSQIKILTAYHKPSHLMSDKDVFIAVHGGRESYLRNNHKDPSEYAWLLENTIGDNTGENISLDNWKYNELSVIFWAYKNWDKIGAPEYVGFSHYRRHFIFSPWEAQQHGRWTVDVTFNQENYDEILNYSKEKLKEYTSRYELIHTLAKTDLSVYEQYRIAPNHNINDLDICLSIIDEIFPSYSQSARNYIHGKNNYFCNMFIMSKELFFEYCEWMFPILNKYDSTRDYSKLSYEEARFFVSERLTGIFIQKHIEMGVSHCPLPITMIMNPEKPLLPKPAFRENNVPVVFAVDDKYAPMLGVALSSLVQNSTSKHNYDILILCESLKRENVDKLCDVVRGKDNFSLRFVDVQGFLSEDIKKKLYIEIHVSIATYYRFFIGQIFKNYPKVVYLDCDIVINDDIAELYDFDLKDNWIGAAIDIRESIPVKQQMMVSNRNWYDYVTGTLGLTDPYQYFQAGVLVYNIDAFYKAKLHQALIESLIKINKPILSDQDILNSVCYKHVAFIPTRWNVEWQIPIEFDNVRNVLNKENYDNYIEALKNPAIVHYASWMKPWTHLSLSLASLWWRYARLSPFYEYFIINTPPESERIIKHYSKNYLLQKKVLYKCLWCFTFGKTRRRFKQKYKSIKHLLVAMKGRN